jgi:hypothetical protein
MVAPVGVYDWLLALHLLAAFAMASGLVLFSAMVIAGRRLDSLEGARTLFRVAPIGGPLVGAGSVLALLLGIAMAIDSDRYQLWDGWVIAALVLWAAVGGVGGRTGKYYSAIEKLAEDDGSEAEVLARLRAPTGRNLHLLVIVLFALLLLDMLFKPGA